MSDAVRLALLIGGFTLIGISITAGAVLISQWIRQHSVVKQGAARPEPTPKAGMAKMRAADVMTTDVVAGGPDARLQCWASLAILTTAPQFAFKNHPSRSTASAFLQR
jgi:hypothetical protein